MESVRVAGECGSATEAIDAIRSNDYDLVLLDVQMPDGTGFDVIREVGMERMPSVVFVTAYDHYALRAFEVNAVDYLLKPFDDIRLRESIERVQARKRMRRTSDELELAGSVQQGLFPSRTAAIADVGYAGRCLPARTLSGDYYDFFGTGPGRLGIVVADVSGKGVPAALLMAHLQGCFRTHIQAGTPGPGALLQSINRLLYESTPPENYATVFYGEYDFTRHRLQYVNCGHLPPFLLRPGQAGIDRLEPTATVLGAFPQWHGDEAVAQFNPGDTLFVYTDGVTETQSPAGEDFGDSRLADVLSSAWVDNPELIIGKVIAAVEDFSRGLQYDDITALALKRLPSRA